jgi:hypothetical protein
MVQITARAHRKRGQGTISDFGIQAEWDAVTHTRDLGGLRLLVSIPAGEGGAVVRGWFNGIRPALPYCWGGRMALTGMVGARRRLGSTVTPSTRSQFPNGALWMTVSVW